MDNTQLSILRSLAGEATSLARRLGKDGEQVKAFYDDLTFALRNESDLEVKAQLLLIPLTLGLLAQKAATSARRNIFAIFTDPLKEFRLRADDFARQFGFSNYMRLRNIA